MGHQEQSASSGDSSTEVGFVVLVFEAELDDARLVGAVRVSGDEGCAGVVLVATQELEY